MSLTSSTSSTLSAPAVGDRVRIERDERRHPSKGTWPQFRGRRGTVVEVTVDRKHPHPTEFGVVCGPLTPSDWRSRRNTIADLQRIAGRKLPRQNAGKHRHRRQAQLSTSLSPAERRASDLVAELVDEAGALRRRIGELIAEPASRAA